ncbi:unnamed protein product [Mytilus coruscus]|uniref:RING-type E3 ubiquitin transferase n=1 Tax=Mytilus coruscus TaxID=42192 RepID=A0A6J8BHT3_MYTCO|nr:unnamed protein product [Mytilus coruscus]
MVLCGWDGPNQSSNNILVSIGYTKLKLINTITGQITVPGMIDHRVIIGATSPGKVFPITGRHILVVLDQEGNQLKEYEHDKHNKRLFTYSRCITSTINGNIYVVDMLNKDGRGRVVVLEPGGDILGIYPGHQDVNTETEPFRPVGILTTPSDNIIVTDFEAHLLHILINQGQVITYYNLSDMEILGPYSLDLSTTGTIFIGCASEKGSTDTTKAKLYELEYSGI